MCSYLIFARVVTQLAQQRVEGVAVCCVACTPKSCSWHPQNLAPPNLCLFTVCSRRHPTRIIMHAIQAVFYVVCVATMATVALGQSRNSTGFGTTCSFQLQVPGRARRAHHHTVHRASPPAWNSAAAFRCTMPISSATGPPSRWSATRPSTPLPTSSRACATAASQPPPKEEGPSCSLWGLPRSSFATVRPRFCASTRASRSSRHAVYVRHVPVSSHTRQVSDGLRATLRNSAITQNRGGFRTPVLVADNATLHIENRWKHCHTHACVCSLHAPA